MKNQERDKLAEYHEAAILRKRDVPTNKELQALQKKLYQKAKQEKGYRFYILYDKIFLECTLREAWRIVKSRNSACGVDGLSVKDIVEQGEEAFLQQIQEELRTQTYRPQAVRRIFEVKANGNLRPIGISCVRDRVVQQCLKFIMEPIFEADFQDCSHGFRPNKSASGAIKSIKEHLIAGKTEVLDADLSAYFDTIPHNKLYAILRLRISDKRITKLIDKILKVPVKEPDGRLTGGKKKKEGVPQGGIISPLLANIYLNLFDRVITNETGVFHKAGISIVRYADDWVLMGKELSSSAITSVKEFLTRMGLTVNEEKTRQVDVRDTAIHFLGFEIRYDKDLFGRGTKYWNIKPSRKSLNKIRESIRQATHGYLHYRVIDFVERLNQIIRGWLNYYDITSTSYMRKAKREISGYLRMMLVRYFNRKSQRKSRLYKKDAFGILVRKHKLIDPIAYTRPMPKPV